MSNPQKGLVYVLSNPAMPGLVKIGQTTNEITSRMNELNTTGVPLPFEYLFACEVDDCKVVGNALHKVFYNNRVNQRREFFEIDRDQAIASNTKIMGIFLFGSWVYGEPRSTND